MISMFVEQVRRHGDKVALHDPASGQSVTYRELDLNARRVAAHLAAVGFGRGDAALILASRGIGFIEAMLGALMAGGIYVPLSDHYPEERVAYIREDCGAKVAIDDAFLAASQAVEPIAAPVAAAPDDIALIAYTSGSTGKPKGILHDHRSLEAAVRRYHGVSRMTDGDVYAINSPFYFIVHIIDVFSPLTLGLTAYIVSDALRSDPEGLSSFIDAHHVTHVFISPKVLRFFRKRGDSLRFVMTGSERLAGIAPKGFRLVNCYGMTETAAAVTAMEVDRAYDNTPIGQPIGDVRAYLLNDRGEPCDEGEICLSGPLGRGYLNLPEQTARTFTPNPFRRLRKPQFSQSSHLEEASVDRAFRSEVCGKERFSEIPFRGEDGFDILIHTGDLGRRLPDGSLLYLNRKDWMIKINGQRVEPGEIEAEARRFPGIDDAVVRDFIDPSGQTFLAAYYLSRQAVDEEALRRALSGRLPEYMVPAHFVRLDKFPVNANGKLDRKALVAPDLNRRRAEYAAPENDRQASIAEAFAQVLGMEIIGIDDDFFSLGGDSIKVMMLQRALGERGIEVAARAIFECHTPRRLSEAAAQASALSAFEGTAAEAYPLTRAQMSVYLDCQTPGKETAYNNVFGLFLPADMEIDVSRLQSSVETVLNRYPILRATTRVMEGMPCLLPAWDARIAVEVRDADTCDREALARRVNTPFDLENEAPCRAVIFRTAEGLFLVLAAHHIVCDGTSISLLAQNIAAACNGEALAEEDMSNLTLAQYEAGHAAELEADAEVYRRILDGMEGDTELYADDDPSLGLYAGKLGVYDTTLYAHQAELSGSLIASLSKHHITEASLFMSAYAYMLRLFCNQKGVSFFVGENGRHDPALQNTVGMLVHNVPVFTRVDEEVDCAAFMAGLQATFHDLVAHDGADFAALIGEYGLRPDCFFVYQGEMLSGVTLGGRTIPMELYRSDDVMATLTLHVLKQPGGDYALRFEYAAEKLTRETVARMAEVYARIVAGLCGGGRLRDIRLVGDDDLVQMDAFNDTGKDWPVTDVVSLFRASAARYPDRPAVIFKDETLTYAQVDDLTERIAGRLRDMGVGRGDVVSILIARSTFMTTASLGVLKSGAGYQPLDPSYPSERLTFMMNDAGAKLLIADEALLERVPEYRGPVLLTRDIPGLPPCAPMAENPCPGDLFILLYTSGSTGKPKGVMLEHGNIANFCAWYREFYHLDEDCRVAAYASYGFDANMMDQYPALTTGASVVIIQEEIRLDLLALEKCLERQGVTHSFMTTQVGRQFYAMANVRGLRYLSVGGEKLVPLPPRAEGPAFYNLYGPTECTVLTTLRRVDRLFERVPIGKPLSNCRCYVVDEYGRRLPPLIPGELLIAGRGVARGYLNRPELTEKAFIRNPFDDGENWARVYRSGDVVRLLPNGEYDFIGRNDGQVKVRGFRIELTEVESVIHEFPGIVDATVQAFEDETSGEKFIAAYVVADDEVDVSALNAFILARKPPYMVPAVTMQLPAIPLNQNQKVNKKALPRPVRQKTAVVPPQNEAQQRIFDCIAEVVGHTDFGITTSIYEAGLSSIGAIRLNVLLSRTFDAAVASKDLKVNDTVEKLEAFLAGAPAGKTGFEVRPDYGLTKTQEGVYVECVAKPGETVYNIPLLLEISDELDLERLKSAIVAAVNAHPILKTRLFLNDDGDVRMRRMDGDTSFDEAAIPVRDIGDIEAEKASLVKPFKLLGGRLFRVEILRGRSTWLFLEAHHIISDGSSMAILLNDISRTYAGEALEVEAFTGYELVLNEEALRAGSAYDDAKAYFDKLLDDAETVNLPAGDVTCGQASKTATLDIESAIPVETFQRFCEDNKCSMNGLFSAAFGLTLDKFLGVDAAVFAGIYSGRNDSRFSGTVAMLVKTLPIVVTQRSGLSSADLVREVSRQLSDSQSNDIYSFAEISRAFRVNADVMFAWQGDEFAFDALCGAPARLQNIQLSEAKAPINLNVFIENGRIRYSMEYRADRYSEAWMRGFVTAVDMAAKGLVKCRWLEQVSILSPEAAGLVARFNDTAVEGRLPTAPELFLKAVGEYGDRPAVIARTGSERLTYRELGERAMKVAGALMEAGVRRGDRVALYMDRTADVYAIRQGIMLAGGAFVSLEPEYPDDRIAFILRDAGISRLITAGETYAPRAALFEAQAGLEVMELADIYVREANRLPLPPIAPDTPAYCIYTSGSTGNPKGVEILHRNLANLLHYDERNTLAKAYVDNASTWLALAAITFDVSIIEEMMPLFHGRAVAMATQDEIHNPLLLMRMVKDVGVDMMKCTPSYLQSILDVPEAREALRELNALIVGAEPFPAAMYRRIREAGFQGTLFNSYGPTETCVSVCIGVLDGGQVNIGGPTMNTAFLIRDKFGNQLPPYARGELVIAGAQVGAGYVNLPEQTREKFIQASVAGRPVNAYRSGDIAYFNGDGVIIHCGRNDNQVKIRGLRIELDGVENVMNTFPGIKRSVVLVKGEGEGKFLCGYYVAEQPVDEAELIAHMKQTLTGYMIPGVFVHLTELPMTVNGKVNKKALPQPEFQQKSRSRKRAANRLQQQIADMFAKALGMDSVGVDEDFFEIGGTSMLASKVAMQAMIAGLPIAYQDIFAFPTVEELERNVLGKSHGGAANDAKPEGGGTTTLEIEAIRPALEYNTMAHIREIASASLGNVLLTGATGFLGIHMLRELIERGEGNITCLVRKGNSETAQKRLESMLVYYFETNYQREFESGRLKAVDGDITDREVVMAQAEQSFDTVLNCAACVKHFASDDILDRVNVQGVKNLIALCESTGSRLVQISTVSVAGENVNHALPDTLVMRENMLYFGQDLSNQYVKSKFDAEEVVLRAVAAGTLRAKIIRVGNLMSRDSDGEFQVNSVTSGFMRNLKGYAAIGAYPVSEMGRPVEFSPIDMVARAVRLLAGTPDSFTVFHAVNGHWIEMGDVIAAMNAAGLPVEIVDEEEFSRRLSLAMQDEAKNMLVSGLISYLSSDADTVRSYVGEDHTFTKNALYRLGYRWPLTGERYLTGAIEALISLDFFSGEGEL